MELRILRYFLAVAEEGSFSRAAERLHVSQPALSQQLAQLEREIDDRLFIRTARRLELTDKAVMLMRRAREIIDLAERTEDDLKAKTSQELVGTIVIGAGETPAFGLVADALSRLRADNPHLQYELISGNGEDLSARLRAGSLDICLFIGPSRYEDFDYVDLPTAHTWGLVLKADDPLARRRSIAPGDLRNRPLIVPRQHAAQNLFTGWLGYPFSRLIIAATYNLLYNATWMARQGVGSVLCLGDLMEGELRDGLTFRPFSPALKSDVYLAWKKGVPPSPATQALIAQVRESAGSLSGRGSSSPVDDT